MHLKPCNTVLQVRPNDLDSLGHVNNATALEYMETGRWDWTIKNGLRPKGPVIAVVARIEVDYRQMIHTNYVQIHTALEQEPDLSGTDYKVVFLQSIYLGDHQVPPDNRKFAVNARVEVGFVDAARQRRTTAQHFLSCAVASDEQ